MERVDPLSRQITPEVDKAKFEVNQDFRINFVFCSLNIPPFQVVPQYQTLSTVQKRTIWGLKIIEFGVLDLYLRCFQNIHEAASTN
ncbi:UNKNOWN [Stylonychia lemnae]|uniref:Uncharacterized protein n=1 Tax=Stylonychia lemnae TaxID=5949 RepID=A0A078A9A2_STYLE|nr:UNKNOWN [Stylonychia lemnae]|eukprot:CDW78850.1 UNKNOWN [Stylonychia lemnae]